MLDRPLRVATFLAPNVLPLYALAARSFQEKLGADAELFVGTSYEQLYEEADVAFICGLVYVELERRGESPVEPIAAPLLRGRRYRGKPVYFSDVIVRRESAFGSFADLRGCRWAFNERYSHSGYGITRYHLVRLGETKGYFGEVIETGWHERSIDLVASGAADASAIDSHVLAVALREDPQLACRLRVIETWGPSTVQPVVASRRLPDRLKLALRDVLLALADDPAAGEHLEKGLVERFVPVGATDYDDLRHMRATCEAANFLTLR